MSRRGTVGSVLLMLAVAGTAGGLAVWKRRSLEAGRVAAAAQPEPMEVIGVADATARDYVRSTTAIGTVRALRSVTLRNELAGTVREVNLTPGAIVEEGTLLVALDVAVEKAELAALEAQAALAETMLGRVRRALENRGASEIDVDRAKAEFDVAKANVARSQAVIERKTIRAPFRARVGLSDLHTGQYLNEGRELTTLQGVDDAVHVDFALPQAVAAGLREGDRIELPGGKGFASLSATIVAIDARVDAITRNAQVRALVEGAAGKLAPGAAVRVRVPVGAAQPAVVIPVTALRKGPSGDHVFAIEEDAQGVTRAHLRGVQSGAILGDVILIEKGLAVGDRVAASGSFKLREGVRVAIAPETGGQ